MSKKNKKKNKQAKYIKKAQKERAFLNKTFCDKFMCDPASTILVSEYNRAMFMAMLCQATDMYMGGKSSLPREHYAFETQVVNAQFFNRLRERYSDDKKYPVEFIKDKLLFIRYAMCDVAYLVIEENHFSDPEVVRWVVTHITMNPDGPKYSPLVKYILPMGGDFDGDADSVSLEENTETQNVESIASSEHDSDEESETQDVSEKAPECSSGPETFREQDLGVETDVSGVVASEKSGQLTIEKPDGSGQQEDVSNERQNQDDSAQKAALTLEKQIWDKPFSCKMIDQMQKTLKKIYDIDFAVSLFNKDEGILFIIPTQSLGKITGTSVGDNLQKVKNLVHKTLCEVNPSYCVSDMEHPLLDVYLPASGLLYQNLQGGLLRIENNVPVKSFWCSDRQYTKSLSIYTINGNISMIGLNRSSNFVPIIAVGMDWFVPTTRTADLIPR